MDFTNDISKIKELLASATDILIATHENPTHDSMGSALALYLGLESLGKKVTIACPDPMKVEFSSYIAAQKVVTTIGKKNFVISLDYVDGSIEKVSYNIEGNTFNLVIEPRPGFEMFSQDKVHYSYSGASAQLIFTVDTIHLGGLKKLFDDDKELYASKPIINLDRHANNAHFGHTNMVDAQATSTAEVVAVLLNGLGVTFSEDIATNFLNAVYGATNNFQNQNISAGAFELVAQSLKSGGKRFRVATTQEEITHGGESIATEPVRIEQTVKPVATQPVVPQVSQAALPVQAKPQQKAPPEWLKPKIFKSSNI